MSHGAIKTPPIELFVSPIKGQPLSETQDSWQCTESSARFPLVGGLPWLFPDAPRVLVEWRNRANSLLGYYENSIASLKTEIKAPGILALTKERLQKTRQSQIRHIEFLKNILSPLKPGTKMHPGLSEGFGYKLPTNQALQGYFPNLLRDWGPHNEENQLAFSALQKTLGSRTSLGRTLVPGAGACRLAYDLHQSGLSSETICLDINPILLLASNRILNGSEIEAVEFATAPKNIEAAAGIVHKCRVPNPTRDGFYQAFGDVYYLPVANESMDTVLTPWLVDILPHQFETLIREINRVLKPGGIWINTGSFNFRLQQLKHCYALEEALQIIENLGFKNENVRQDEIPYLHSDLDSHRRTEVVTSFVMEKTHALESYAPVPMKPDWLLNPNQAVPPTPFFQGQFLSFESQAFVLSLVDGKRSVQDMAALVAQRYGMNGDEAMEAVTSFLTRQYESSVFQR